MEKEIQKNRPKVKVGVIPGPSGFGYIVYASVNVMGREVKYTEIVGIDRSAWSIPLDMPMELEEAKAHVIEQAIVKVESLLQNVYFTGNLA